ncbi:MAG: hypothetical protein JST00_12315 [Deltaproteobacteria bacterium]|nr:hypothetical protein [Deltaproteobacteria bacterium]
MAPDHVEEIATLVRAGYMTVAEIAETIGDMIDDEGDDERPTSQEVLEAVQSAMEERRRQLDVKVPSSYDRLRRAFDLLEERGVLARENYWCCQTCAYSAIDQEIDDGLEAGAQIRGYVLFHSQDTDRAVESGHLLLRYGGVTADPEREGADASKKIGEEVVALLRSSDFEPLWSGSPDDVITLPIHWDKRPPADA